MIFCGQGLFGKSKYSFILVGRLLSSDIKGGSCCCTNTRSCEKSFVWGPSQTVRVRLTLPLLYISPTKTFHKFSFSWFGPKQCKAFTKGAAVPRLSMILIGNLQQDDYKVYCVDDANNIWKGTILHNTKKNGVRKNDWTLRQYVNVM